MESKQKQNAGRKPVGDIAKKAVFQIRTTDEEKAFWSKKAKLLGFGNTADMFRQLVSAA